MKVLFVTTISNTVNAFLIPHIKMLVEQGHQVDVAFNTVQEVKQEIMELGCNIYNIEFQRSPFSKQNISAYKKLKDLIEYENYDLVHTHTPIASVIVRLVCKNVQGVKVVYTAHGFHFYKGAPIQNWLIYYPVEKWLSKHTDVLITINKEDYDRAKKTFKTKLIEYVPGVGLDTSRFQNLNIDKQYKRKELGVPSDAFMLLSIGELNRNKNHETVIKALAKLRNPNVFYVICGQGPLEVHLKKLISDLGLRQQVILLGYRKDIVEICKAADLFVFPSYREGLPVSLMEAMASRLPVVCSNVRGNKDLIVQGKGGYLVKPDDEVGFANAIDTLLNDHKSLLLYAQNNFWSIKKFAVPNIIKKMNNIYNALKGENCG